MTQQHHAEDATDWGDSWFRVDARDHYAIVSAGGEIDVRTAVGLGRANQDAISHSARLVIDLTHVTFMDSTGLGALISARNQTRARGGSVSLVHPPDLVRKILAGTQLQQAFTVFDTMDEALDAMKAP